MLEWIVSSSILTAIMIALRWILKGKISPRLQYALWGLVLLRLLIPFYIGSSSFSVMNPLQSIPIVQESKSISGVDYIAHMPDGSVKGYEPSDFMGDFPLVAAAGKTAAEYARMEKLLFLRKILMPVWLYGAVMMFAAFAASNGRFALRLRRTRKPLEVKGAAIPVYITAEADTPCLFGLFSPAIYVTPEAAEDAAALRYTVEHETSHFRRGDNFWSALRGICLVLHWYNPLVWWAAALSRRDAELACDEATIRRIGESERAEYGRALIGMTCRKCPALLTAATTMTGGKSGIRERITLLTSRPKTALRTLVAVVLIAAVAVGCTFTGAKKHKEPWSWAMALSRENIVSADLWTISGSRALPDDELTALVSIINSLRQEDFTENKDAAGGTPAYGLRIITRGGTYNINESIAPAGAFEMTYDGRQWWFDCEALEELLRSADDNLSVPALPEYSAADIDGIIIDCLNSDGAYAEAAQSGLIACLIKFPAQTLEAVGARDAGIQAWLCWYIAANLKEWAMGEPDALTLGSLSENGAHAQALIVDYLAEDQKAPKSWRQVYLDFWNETLSAQASDGGIVGIGLMDFNFDGVPEFAAWQPAASASEFAVLYYTDGLQAYHNVGSGYTAVLWDQQLTDDVPDETPPPTFWLVKNRETGMFYWCVHSQNGQDYSTWGGYQLLYADDEQLIGSYETEEGARKAWEAFHARYEIFGLDYSAFVLSALAGDSLDAASVNAFLNSWRPPSAS